MSGIVYLFNGNVKNVLRSKEKAQKEQKEPFRPFLDRRNLVT